MQQRFLHAIACVALATGAGCLRIPDDLAETPDGAPSVPASAEEVLERHIKAIGGAPKLHGIKQRTVEARMVFRAEAGCEEGDNGCFAKDQKGSFVLQTTADGRLYRRTVLGEVIEERGFDGKTGWSLGSDGILQLDTEDERIASREDALLHWYFDVAKRGIETTLLTPRKQDSDGRVMELDGVQWRVDAQQPPKAMWFDRSTGLLREEVVEEGEGDTLSTQTILYDDYEKVDGVLVPFKIRVINKAGTREQVVEFTTQSANHRPVDTTKFAVPKLTKPAPVADPILAALAKAREAAKAAPKDVAASVALARAEFIAGHFSEAEAAANTTLAMESKEPEALFILARAQMFRGDLTASARTLARAEKAGVKPEVIQRQLTWIHLRRREYGKLGKLFDELGNPVMAGRYRAFTGKAFAYAGGECVITPKLQTSSPIMIPEIEISGKTTGAIFDTGSAEVILAASYAKDIDLAIRAKTQINDQGAEIGYGQVDTLLLGGAKLQNVPVAVLPDATIAEMAADTKGKVRAVIGAHALTDFLITVDVPGKKLELVAPGAKCKAARDARRTGTAVPFWLHETHYVYLRAMLGPAEGIYLLNSGMHGADLAATPAAYAFAGIGAPPIRADEAPMVTVDSFSLGGGIELTKLVAAFGFFDQTQTSDEFRLDGMVGLGTLGKKRFTLDYDTQKIWFGP